MAISFTSPIRIDDLLCLYDDFRTEKRKQSLCPNCTLTNHKPPQTKRRRRYYGIILDCSKIQKFKTLTDMMVFVRLRSICCPDALNRACSWNHVNWRIHEINSLRFSESDLDFYSGVALSIEEKNYGGALKEGTWEYLIQHPVQHCDTCNKQIFSNFGRKVTSSAVATSAWDGFSIYDSSSPYFSRKSGHLPDVACLPQSLFLAVPFISN